jgi:hypothetical protein
MLKAAIQTRLYFLNKKAFMANYYYWKRNKESEAVRMFKKKQLLEALEEISGSTGWREFYVNRKLRMEYIKSPHAIKPIEIKKGTEYLNN